MICRKAASRRVTGDASPGTLSTRRPTIRDRKARAGRVRAVGSGAILLLGLLWPLGEARAEPRRYRIDPEHFSILFEATHIGYQDVLGMFLQGGGGFTYDEAARRLSDLKVTIRAASVFTNHKDRDRHLRGKDFLWADQHPDITFVMTRAEPIGERTGRITGDLTLRGVTKPITVDVTLNKIASSPINNAYTLGISARAVVKRSLWGSTYAADVGWVPDEIPLRFELEAIRE